MTESTPVHTTGRRPARTSAVAAAICLVIVAMSAPVAAGAQDSEIDAFMEEVLSRRVRNWEDLYRYTVRDRESVEIRGPLGVPLESYRADYVWYVRDGYMVRSPQKINGVSVGDDERDRFERRFLERLQRREQERRERAEKRAAEAGGNGAEADGAEGGSMERENFLGFPFEPGNYFLAGRETIDGLDLLKVEYYPEKLFSDDDRDADDEVDPEEEDLIRRFQKTSRVTMWVLPEEHQIVRITFDNVGLEFLPARWLIQVDDVSATLQMDKLEAEGVWLPRSITAHGQATVATGTFELVYSLEYFDYRKAEVEAKVRYALPEQERQR